MNKLHLALALLALAWLSGCAVDEDAAIDDEPLATADVVLDPTGQVGCASRPPSEVISWVEGAESASLRLPAWTDADTFCGRIGQFDHLPATNLHASISASLETSQGHKEDRLFYAVHGWKEPHCSLTACTLGVWVKLAEGVAEPTPFYVPFGHHRLRFFPPSAGVKVPAGYASVRVAARAILADGTDAPMSATIDVAR